MKSFCALLNSLVLFIFFQTGVSTQSFAQASLPHIISYQGILIENGVPITNGQYAVTTRLYSDTAGSNLIWTDTYTVQFTGGSFNIALGSGAVPLPSLAAMNRPLWLGVQIGSTSELRPLSALMAAPFALNIADSSVTNAKMSDGGATPGYVLTANGGRPTWLAPISLPSGAIVLFGDNGTHAGYSLIANTSAGGDTWSTGAVLPFPQYSMASAVVNGKIYVIGGQAGSQNYNQIYDPVANTWSTGMALPVGQYGMTSAVVNGKIYVIGGGNGSENNNQIYDAVANTWSTGAVLPVGQLFPSSAVVSGKIFVLGGRNSNSNQIYDPATNTWITGTPLPVAQDGKANVVNGKIYVMGGETIPYNNNQIYDPATNTWSAGKVLPVGTFAGTSAVVNGRIYLLGGENSAYTDNQIYNPATDTWSTGAALPVGEDVTASGVVNGKIYVFGGLQGSSNYNQIYSPALTLYYFMKN